MIKTGRIRIILLALFTLVFIGGVSNQSYAFEAPELKTTKELKCGPCAVGEIIGELSDRYAKTIFEKVRPSAVSLFAILAVIWGVYMTFYMILDNGTPLEFLKGVGFIMAASVFLSTDQYWNEWIYSSTIALMVKLSIVVVNVTDSVIPVDVQEATNFKTALVQMIAAMTRQVELFFDLGLALIKQGGIYSLSVLGAGIVMLLSLALMMAMYLGQLGVCIFRIVAITAIGPLVITAWAFKSTRGLATGAIKHIAASVLIMTLASVGMGLTGYFFEGILTLIPMEAAALSDGHAEIDVSEMAKFPWGWKFIAVIMTTWLAIAYQWEAGSLGAGLLGVFLNSAGPAIFAAGTVAAAALPLKAIRGGKNLANDAKTLGKGAENVWNAGKGVGRGMSKMAQYMAAVGKDK